VSAPAVGTELSFTVSGVADVSSAVADGAVNVEPGTDGTTLVHIAHPAPVANEAALGEDVPPTLVGRYLLTVLPDDVRFRWELSVHNPNRRAVHFTVPARADEKLEGLETTAHHEATAAGFSVELPPGDTALTVIGAMTGTHFQPPVEAAAQLVLVDSHPLLRLDLNTDGKRVSPEETGLQAQYRAAQGVLLARGQGLTWKPQVLRTLTAARYSVRNARTLFFVGADGALLGQSSIALENEGAPELTLPMKGTPEFASIGGTSVPLTHTDDGQLRLPLSHGEQNIVVQHRGALKTGFGLAAGTLELPGLGTPATYSNVELRTGRDWSPLFVTFAGQRWFALPGIADLLLTLLFGLWAVHLLVSFGVNRRPAMALGALTAVLAASTEAAHWPVLFGLAGGSMLWVVAWLRESKVRLVAPSGLVGISMVLGLGMLLMVGGVTLFGDNIRRLFGMSADALAGDDHVAQGSTSSADDSGLTRKTMKSFGAATGYESVAAAQPSYQGVGAQRELPLGRRSVSLSQEMADTTAPTAASVVLISTALVQGGYALLHVLAVALAFMMRRQLLAGLKVQLERLFGRPAAVAGAVHEVVG
jgi:hypothetical protein